MVSDTMYGVSIFLTRLFVVTAIETKTQSAEQCAKSLEREVDFFRNRLGLRLKKVSGKYGFVSLFAYKYIYHKLKYYPVSLKFELFYDLCFKSV